MKIWRNKEKTKVGKKYHKKDGEGKKKAEKKEQ
jgi:hypothetical protein